MRKTTFNLLTSLGIAAALFTLFTTTATADKKKYVWTIEYQTMERGEAEIEHYWTAGTSDFSEFGGNTTNELQFEIEVGMTDHFDVRFYQVFEQKPESSFDYKGFKVETRYRLGEKGSNPVDQLIYVEYKNKPDFSQHKFELKYILAKDFGKWNVALNPILEIEEEDDGYEYKPEYALGISYEMHKLLSFGIEFKGSEDSHYVGPTISHGSNRFWFATGALFGYSNIDPGETEFQVRTIFGLVF